MVAHQAGRRLMAWVVSNARGVGRLHVPLAQALRVAETLFGGLAERRGRLLVAGDLGRRLSRQLAPALGARAPDEGTISIERLDVDADGLRLRLSEGAELPILSPEGVRNLPHSRVVVGGEEL